MGRRRSASSTTRIFQGLFALIWIGFMFYMISGYLKKKPDADLAGEGNPNAEVADSDSGTSTSPKLTLPSANLAESTTLPLNSNPATAAANQTKQPPAGPTARAILNNVLAAYKNASSYADRGVLKLAYQIGDRRFAEQYPWNSRWSNDGRVQTDIFEAKVRGDGKLLSCFVSEIRSENLKNQQLFLRGGQLIQQLYRDKIAAYYLNGGERIPVNETIVPNSTLLTPPAIALLSGEVPSPWFTSTTQTERLKDDTVEGNDCFVIRCSANVGQLIAWVDKKTALIRRVKLPNEILDPMLAADPKVNNLNLFATFTDASFNVNQIAFDPVVPQEGVWPVREFVAPADALPTNLLGEMVPEFTLLDAKRAKVTDRKLQGKPTSMLFVNGDDSDADLIQKFETLRQTLATSGYEFMVVAGPNAIERSQNGSWRLAPTIQPAANRSKLLFLADFDGVTARAFEFASMPAVVTINSRLDIQYADLLTKPAGYNGKITVNAKWDQRLAAAITASKKGINVADDMRAKYRSYLDKYFSERDARSVASYFPGYRLPGQQKIAAVPVNVRREQTAQRSVMKLNPRLVWESDHLTQPGNIALIPGPRGGTKGLLILDGWQTVNLFSVDGKPVSRKRLEIPEGVAVTSIRSLVSDSGEQRFAMFSAGGNQVLLFDERMELVDSFPSTRESRSTVLACEVLPGSAGKADQLLVCFGGSGGAKIFDVFTKKSRSVGDTAVRSIALSGRSVVAVDARTGALLSMDNGRTIDDRREYSHVVSGANGASVFAATVMNSSREWSLALFDSTLKSKREFPISSAIFENGLEPVTGVSLAGKGTWAVADSSNRIYLLSDAGVWLGDMAADGNVSGLKLVSVEGRTRLIVSTDKKIECWELNFAPDRVGARGGRVE